MEAEGSRSQPDATVALNQILSEIIDVVQEVKQARLKVPLSHPLHTEVDHLLEDVVGWTRLLIVQDEVLGLSPLARMQSVAGRKPPNLWPGAVSDDEVRQLLDEHLERLDQHVTAALEAQTDKGSRAALGDVHASVVAHRIALGDPHLSDP